MNILSTSLQDIAPYLPATNAALNGISTLLLVTGIVFIKRGEIRAHGWTMGAAFVVSSIFLIGYLLHKKLSGDKSSGLSPGLLRTLYFAILIPHVILAIVMVPMIITVLLRAYRRQWDKHRRLAKITFPIWLYVSVTGVIIYWMLYHLFPKVNQ